MLARLILRKRLERRKITAAPGETLTLRAEITGRMGNLVQAKGNVAVGERNLLAADVVLAGA